jgi:hypothetical protein
MPWDTQRHIYHTGKEGTSPATSRCDVRVSGQLEGALQDRELVSRGQTRDRLWGCHELGLARYGSQAYLTA